MKTIFLNYKENSIEKSYKASALEMGYKLFLLIMMVMFIDIATFTFPGIFEMSEKKIPMISITILIIGLTFIGFLLKKRIKILRNYSALLLIVYIVICIEILEYSKDIDGKGNIVIIVASMMSINFGLTCIIYFNFSWVIFFLFNVFLSIYMMLRVFGKSDWEPEKIVKFIELIIVNGLMSYCIEKSTRKNYFALYNSNEMAKTYQSLIDEVLPTPIIIKKIKDSSICFYNQAMVQSLKSNYKFESDPDQVINIKTDSVVLKKIINEYLILMKITEKEIGMDNNTTLADVLDNFDNLILKEKELGTSCTFLHKELFLQVSKQPFKEKLLSFDNRKDEEDKYFDVKIKKILWQNEECFMIIFSDITSIISLSKFKDIDIYKNRLLATVSHDLRTPINGMLGMIETVSSDLKEKKHKKLLKMAGKFGSLLLSMINDILDFSKISNCQLRLNLEPMSPVSLIKEVCELLKSQIKSKGLEFSFEKINLPVCDFFISSDPNRLKQILLNLVSNSLKFTFKGHIKIVFELTAQKLLKITVADTGIGIKENNISKLFTLFGKLKQEDPSINRQGVGLGLVISQNLSKLLYLGPDNGIHVESAWNVGSKFWFYVSEFQQDYEEFNSLINDKINSIHDFLINDNKKTFQRDSQSSLVDYSKKKKKTFNQNNFRILIVDDDQINLLVAKEYMKFFNMNYILANNGKEALQIIEKQVIVEHQKIDAILMDCNMPIMDGFIATTKIKEALEAVNEKLIPIIALTANVSSVDVDLCFQSGMNYYLSKPVSRKELSNTLEKILNVNLPK